MNDCGWDISPDNYHYFLEQINATNTSVGRWRVGDFTSGKAGQFFGRFARSFEHATGRDDMFFAVRGGVFAATPQAKPVHLRVVYYDDGTGSWSVRHGPGCANETKFTKKGTGLWAEATLDIAGPFAQSCARGADFVLHNSDGEDDSFAFVELSAQPLVNLFVKP